MLRSVHSKLRILRVAVIITPDIYVLTRFLAYLLSFMLEVCDNFYRLSHVVNLFDDLLELFACCFLDMLINFCLKLFITQMTAFKLSNNFNFGFDIL